MKSSKFTSTGLARVLAVFFFILLVAVTASLVFFFSGPKTSKQGFSIAVERFSGVVEVASKRAKDWTKVTRRAVRTLDLGAGDRIRTGEGADVDLKVASVVDLRLKPNSELQVVPSRKSGELRIKLIKGSLLGLIPEELDQRKLVIETGESSSSTVDASFLIQTSPNQHSTISVLDGQMEVSHKSASGSVIVPPLSIMQIKKGSLSLPEPTRVTYQSWRSLNEVRDLMFETVEETERQIDLRSQAGSLFEYVFDDGAFFTPNLGYAKREFYKNVQGEVILRIDYDVYPQNSFTGLYFKTRDLDAANVKRLKFELKSGQMVPKMIRVEIKRGVQTVRGFAIKPITPEWRLYSFDFNAQQETPVSEIVFVFENARVGALSRKGTVYLKNIEIE